VEKFAEAPRIRREGDGAAPQRDVLDHLFDAPAAARARGDNALVLDTWGAAARPGRELHVADHRMVLGNQRQVLEGRPGPFEWRVNDVLDLPLPVLGPSHCGQTPRRPTGGVQQPGRASAAGPVSATGRARRSAATVGSAGPAAGAVRNPAFALPGGRCAPAAR